MELEKYTERSKGFIQSAQNLALRSGHQRLTPEHLLKVLLDDKEGLCANLIRAAGGDPQAVLAAVEAELDKLAARSRAAAPARSISGPELARVFDQAEKIAEKAGDSYRHRRAAAAGAGAWPRTRRPARRSPPAGSRRRASTPRSRRCARAARPTAPRPRRAMTR